MRTLLGLIIIALISFLGARRLFASARLPLGAQLIFLTGTEYIFLGAILGPHLTGLLTTEVLENLSPLIALGLGWVGLMFGVQLEWRRLRRVPRRYFGIAGIESLVTAAVLFGVFRWLVLPRIHPGDSGLAVVAAALSVAAMGTPTSPSATALVIRHLGKRTRLGAFLGYLSGMDSFMGILLFGLVFCLYHSSRVAGVPILHPLEWLTLSILLGVVLGLLLDSLTRPRYTGDELVLMVIGMVIFAGGVSAYLRLSALFVTTVLGITFCNRSPLGGRIYTMLQATEKPFYIIFLLLAGALWLPPLAWAYLAVPAYLLVRALGKLIGTGIGRKFFKPPYSVPGGVGLGLLSQGGMAVAMVVNYQQVYGGDLTRTVTTVVLLAVVLNELISPGLLERFLGGDQE